MEDQVDKVQGLCYEMAQQGIECTPKEIKVLIKIAKRLKSLAMVPKNELKGILDLKDPKQKAVFDTVMKFKNS